MYLEHVDQIQTTPKRENKHQEVNNIFYINAIPNLGFKSSVSIVKVFHLY